MTASLLSRSLHLAVLASGSKGNCTYVGDGLAGVLIDCGISTKQILARLEAVGLAHAPIDAVLVTHEHSDHVGAAGVLSRRLHRMRGRHVPFFMTEGTRRGLRPNATPDAIETFAPGATFQVGHLDIDPFPIPHDTADPVAYRVGVGGTWVGVVTDLGRPTTLVTDKLRTLRAGVLEFNHELDLLLGGPYPWPLKQRVRSSHGHLSNDQAADLLERSLTPQLGHVLLGHLSEENNRPHVALARAARVLAEAGASGDVKVGVAAQHEPSPPIEVQL